MEDRRAGRGQPFGRDYRLAGGAEGFIRDTARLMGRQLARKFALPLF